jgi:hypothetical protein
MADMKLVVVYPRPKDVDVFEKVYQEEHVSLGLAAQFRNCSRLSQPRYSPPRKVFLLSTALPKFIFRRCKLWKHAQRLKAAKRRSLTP